MTTETLSYDDNGQLIRREKSTGEVTTYEWNDQGMLVKVILPNGEPVEYQYDGNQRLTGRISADGVDQFVQSGWDIMTKTDDVGKRTYYTGMSAVSGAGSSSGSFVPGSSSGSSSGSSAVEGGDSVKYFHYNHRGDTVLVTDSEGNILNNFSYEAYGQPTNNEGIPFNSLSIKDLPNLFTGASGIRYDTKTNLHYMRFRWFSAAQMRFISPDLLMDSNRYAYVSGNPISFIDPLGLEIDAIGPTGKIIWKDIVKDNGNTSITIYPLPEYNGISKVDGYANIERKNLFEERLTEMVLELLKDLHKSALKDKSMLMEKYFIFDPAVVLCTNWRDKFVSSCKSARGNGLDVLEKRLNEMLEDFNNPRVAKVEAFTANLGIHVYVYIKVTTIDVMNIEKTIWIMTETNATETLPGDTHYRSRRIRPPDVFLPKTN